MFKTNPQAVLYIRHIPQSIKKDFKSYCAQRGISMTDAIIQLIQKATQEEKSPKTKS